MEQNFKIKVNDSFYNNFKSSDINELDVIKLSKSKLHVINNHKSFDIKIEKSDFLKKEYIVQVNSNNYTIKLSNQLDLLIKEMGLSVGSTKKINDLKAPMPGLILSINVKEKQKIKEGETLLILEAMKMENAIASPKDGVIKTIHIKSGGTVEKGELMIEFE